MPERRKDHREEAFLLGECAGITFYIVDISDAGLKISAESPLGEVDNRIEVHIQVPSNLFEKLSFYAKILWLREHDGVFFYGIALEPQEGLMEKIQHIKELCHFVGRIRNHLLS